MIEKCLNKKMLDWSLSKLIIYLKKEQWTNFKDIQSGLLQKFIKKKKYNVIA